MVRAAHRDRQDVVDLGSRLTTEPTGGPLARLAPGVVAVAP